MKKNDAYTFQVFKNDQVVISIPIDQLPDAQFRECWETDGQIIVCGTPEYDDESHNCDEMGCSSVSHVLYRFDKSLKSHQEKKLISAWMNVNVGIFPTATELAEAAAWSFEREDWLEDPDHWVWDLAVDVIDTD